MDRVAEYRRIAANLVKEYASYTPYNGQIIPEAVIDDEHGHYEVVHVGWDGVRRVHGSVIHLDIIGDKIWIQYDGTSRPVAEELVRAGLADARTDWNYSPVMKRRFLAAQDDARKAGRGIWSKPGSEHGNPP